ncbi:MAG TPA: NUDIX hydrolase [Candidatus Fimivivens sp.]|nr:NUDIX hydrolase [Candidatus Fimivivens sp.]
MDASAEETVDRDTDGIVEPWTTLSKEIVHKNPWFSVSKESFVTPKRNVGEYFVIHTKDKSRSVMIVPVEGDEIVLARQYRYPTKRWCLEVPGGAVEKEDSIEGAAKKELEEELGFQGELRKVGEYCPWSGPAEEICTVYLATGLTHVGQNLEEGEDLTLERIRIAEVYRMLDDGEFTEGQTIVALSFARKHVFGEFMTDIDTP